MSTFPKFIEMNPFTPAENDPTLITCDFVTEVMGEDLKGLTRFNPVRAAKRTTH